MSREIKEGVVIGDIHFYECNESDEHMCSKCGAQTGNSDSVFDMQGFSLCCSLCKKCYKYMTKDCATVRIEGDGVLFPRTGIYPSAEVIERDAMRRRAEHLRLNGEVYCKSNLDILIKRDTKRLYSKAISGELNNLTGISFNTPYEPPSDPNIIINMGENNIDESLNY